MSTALSVVPVSQFQAFDETSRAAKALAANTDGVGFSQSDLITVKTPSGGAQFWEVPGPSGPQAVPEITGLLVFRAYQGIIWPSTDPSPSSKPVIVTRDMNKGILQAKAERDADGKITAIEGAPDSMVEILRSQESSTPGVFDWKTLPYTQFGSGKNKSGKYAKEGALLFILRSGSVLPIIVKTGPSALKGIRNFLTQVEYPFWQCIVGLTLSVDEAQGNDPSGRPVSVKYSLAKISLKSVISDPDADVVKTKYTDLLRNDWEAGNIDQQVNVD